PERRSRGLAVQLAGLRQVGLAQVEVVGGEELARLLADGPGQDRGVDQGKIALIEEVADGLDHLMADPGNGHLPPAPEPEVSMLEEESRPMFFRGERTVGTRSEDFEIGYRQLEAARRPCVGPDGAGHGETRFLWQRLELLPDALGDFLPGQYALQLPGAVP